MGSRTHLVAALVLASTSAVAGGDAVRGQQVYEMRCGGCHSVETDRVGPRHAGLIGRRAGAVPGFAYSPALASSKLVWNASTLDRWLSNPEALVPGQRMGYSLSDAAQRADVIAYLSTLKPAP